MTSFGRPSSSRFNELFVLNALHSIVLWSLSRTIFPTFKPENYGHLLSPLSNRCFFYFIPSVFTHRTAADWMLCNVLYCCACQIRGTQPYLRYMNWQIWLQFIINPTNRFIWRIVSTPIFCFTEKRELPKLVSTLLIHLDTTQVSGNAELIASIEIYLIKCMCDSCSCSLISVFGSDQFFELSCRSLLQKRCTLHQLHQYNTPFFLPPFSQITSHDDSNTITHVQHITDESRETKKGVIWKKKNSTLEVRYPVSSLQR